MKRRLLYVTPFSLLPPVEGHRKRMAMTFGAIKQAGFEIHVLFIPREYEWSELFDPAVYKDLLDVADLTFFCHANTPGPPRGEVYELDEWWPAHADDYCRWLFGVYGYEFVFCNYIFMSRVFELATRATIKLLDTHDLFADRKKLLVSHGLKPEFFYTTADAEVTGVERADIVLAIKEQEAEYFRKVSEARVITLPYCETARPLMRAAPERPAGAKPRFGFFGSNNSINIKNINEFIAFLADRQPAEGFGFELWLYGSLCKRLPATPPDFVKLGGFVDTVEEFYEAVDCVVNPQYFSTGLKIKVAEALAYHAPLICHRHSFEGFGAPLHPAQDCDGFAQVMATMTEAADDPELLREIAAASVAVQTRLEKECGRQIAKVLAGSRIGLKWLYIFVDGDTFNRSRLYRHIVESFFATFSASHLIACIGAGASAGPWGQFSRKANRTAAALAGEDIEPGARCVFFEDPAKALGAAAPAGAVVFVDAARIAQGRCGPAWRSWLSEAALTHVLVRCEGLGEAAVAEGEGCLSVRYFRWLPWDMALSGGADHHDQVPEVWVLGEAQVDDRWYRVVEKAFPALRMRVFREDCADDRSADCAIEALNDAAFTSRQAPRLVIRLAADRGFDAFSEWCVANGVPFRSYIRYARPDSAGRRMPLLPARLSEFAALPTPGQDLAGPMSSWGASGWEDLAGLMKAGLVRA
ncbi:MAG: glycosyltransferase [Caulobacteraceae bacterium]